MLPFHLPAVSGLGCWMLLCFLPRRQVSNRFLSQRMHILLVFICRFPWGTAYQKECSLGNSCKWHGVCTQPEIRAGAAGQGSENQKKTAPRGMETAFSYQGASPMPLWEWEKRKGWWSCNVVDWELTHVRPAHSPDPRSSLNTHFKRNVLNIGQISLLCQLTFLNCLISVLIPTSSGLGPLYLSCPDQLLNYLFSSPTGFCSKSTQPRASKLVAGINRSKCNFPEQEGGENLNAT